LKWRAVSNILNSLKKESLPPDTSIFNKSYFPGEENIEEESSLRIKEGNYQEHSKAFKQQKPILTSLVDSIKNNQAFLDLNKFFLGELLERWRERAIKREVAELKREKESSFEINWKGSLQLELRFRQIIFRKVKFPLDLFSLHKIVFFL
jgi:hypothetical protein